MTDQFTEQTCRMLEARRSEIEDEIGIFDVIPEPAVTRRLGLVVLIDPETAVPLGTAWLSSRHADARLEVEVD